MRGYLNSIKNNILVKFLCLFWRLKAITPLSSKLSLETRI